MAEIVELRDTRFILYKQLHIEELFQYGRFQGHSRESLEMILTAAEELAVESFAPVNSIGDEVGCSYSDGKVKVPEAFRTPFEKYCGGGWICMAEDEKVGGQNVPLAISFACNELFFGANHSLAGYMGLIHTAAKNIELFGSPEQKRKYMTPLYQGRYAGTMCLTESEAGSDVGAILTKAKKNPDGSYSIVGNKIFITGGEQNLTENIIHIVLARIEGDPEGTEGLSCFIVPKILISEDGTLGNDNNVVCLGIEHKMGMKGSATCTLGFGDNGVCKGELLGPPRKGIKVAFFMMNEQRVLVGLQGLAQASHAYLSALQYARERKQGSDFGSKERGQVPIIRHPDVKRNLLWMKSYTEGMRALIMYTLYCIDRSSVITDTKEKRPWQDVLDILIPVTKAYCTDKGFEVCTRAIQVYGGYGYCREAMVEQFARDCKVTSLYEGTNGIQANDLLGRKIRAGGSASLNALITNINRTCEEAKHISELLKYAVEVEKSVSALKELTDHLHAQIVRGDVYLAHAWATPYLEIVGDIVLAWMLLWQAKLASNLLTTGEDGAFYNSKINTARFYLGSLLPIVHGKIEAIKRNENSLLNVGENSF